jgi:uncharacterized membrane protein
MQNILLYVSTLIPLVMLDAIWLLYLGKPFYEKTMGFLFTESFKMGPAFVFYPLYAFAVFFLVLMPGIASSSGVLNIALKGAILGLAAYGAYDLTNHATIPNWPLSMTLVDMAWGVFVTLATSVIGYYIYSFIK